MGGNISPIFYAPNFAQQHGVLPFDELREMATKNPTIFQNVWGHTQGAVETRVFEKIILLLRCNVYYSQFHLRCFCNCYIQ